MEGKNSVLQPKKYGNTKDQGQIIQNIVSLTSSLRGQLVQRFTTFQPNTLIFLDEKMREAFAFSHFLVEKMREASQIFSTKNIGINQILTFEILT